MAVSTSIQKRRLGRTELMVTELGMGGYMFTGEFRVPQKEAHAILDIALEAGINYTDTAQMYGFGEGEELIGRALERHPDKDIHISTKVGYLDRTVARCFGPEAYNDTDAIRRAINHSLWILRRDYVDIMYVHEPDNKDWWGDTLLTGKAAVLDVLDEFKNDGIIGAIGIGGWKCDNIADLLETGRFDVALVAGGYTLVNQPVKDRVIPAAKKHDAGLVMGGTFLQGALATIQREAMHEIQHTGKYTGWLNELTVKKVLAIYDLCDETGMSVTEMAIRYILNDTNIHAVIPGAQKVSHIKANIAAAMKGPLPEELIQRINEINIGI
ncbi:MAG: aldo/keto reductase [Armatimonadota bacterium]